MHGCGQSLVSPSTSTLKHTARRLCRMPVNTQSSRGKKNRHRPSFVSPASNKLIPSWLCRSAVSQSCQIHSIRSTCIWALEPMTDGYYHQRGLHNYPTTHVCSAHTFACEAKMHQRSGREGCAMVQIRRHGEAASLGIYWLTVSPPPTHQRLVPRGSYLQLGQDRMAADLAQENKPEGGKGRMQALASWRYKHNP